MKIKIFITFLFFCSSVYSQKKTFQKIILSEKREYLNDSNLLISDYLPLEISSFYINFSQITFNKKGRILHIVGQTKVNKITKTGFPGAIIFTGYRIKNQIKDTANLAFSTFLLNDDFSSSGYFDISFKVKKNMRLYFHRSSFFLNKYNLDRL